MIGQQVNIRPLSNDIRNHGGNTAKREGSEQHCDLLHACWACHGRQRVDCGQPVRLCEQAWA